MRSGRELISDSKQFSCESRGRSWFELLITLFLAAVFFSAGMFTIIPFVVRLGLGLICGLLYVRLFVIYHDYEHRAILQNSSIAHWIMMFIGVYLLAPEAIWRRSHEYHHNNNSKLTLSSIGSYPTISKARFLKLSKKERQLYLINRHPLTIFFGYLTLFIYWLNVKSYLESPKKHLDSLLALIFHFAAATCIMYFLGVSVFIAGWVLPFFTAFSIGSYLFYSQHNFPGAKFRENNDWAYDQAALTSTSMMVMNPVMNWFTGNIGYHHVHHLNSRIPFYRLKEAMTSMPELTNVATTTLNPRDINKCLRLKLWDAEKGEMITLKEVR
jgi:omega-6 fatty acid desaturase (delta-12 desaturase)